MTIPPVTPSMGELQEREHGVGHDCAAGSPHIRHHTIRDRLIGGLRTLVQQVTDRNGQCRVLEPGAGHGKQLIESIVPGGAFLSAQDPLWYPRRSRVSMSLDRNAYFLWHLGQGELRRGLATRLRRVRGVYDDTNEADMVEYHVVRDSVDEDALRDLLAPHFATVEVRRYWSTQSGLLQAVGERLFPPTTFGLVATERV
ncbi:hypothetical protein QFZ55_003668 [Streptomyces luteogriseus]|uniref:SAM-dependent methyltransferase n=1 Tax=Streptomyces luteogriseus TaxID=68233 RepID=UPI00277E09F6|nr:SAM-dependent methyltransferase [Streptomyces luteogriseus]MDQ0714216.1 hypothetical protein [Streptomyces luteogriseus]